MLTEVTHNCQLWLRILFMEVAMSLCL